MCRHLGYLGPAIAVGELVVDPPHGLLRQVEHPRHQAPGITNTDGWGLAWWSGDGDDPPRHHRTTVPLTSDAEGRELLRRTRAVAFLAAVRRASPWCAVDASGNAPFVSGRWAFSLNGFVGGFAGPAGDELRHRLSPGRRQALGGDTDSEVLFGLVLDGLDAGLDPAAALRRAYDAALEVAARARSRLNLLLGDGHGLWATRWSNSLFTRRGDGWAAVASEPWDDDPAWREVADGEVVALRGG